MSNNSKEKLINYLYKINSESLIITSKLKDFSRYEVRLPSAKYFAGVKVDIINQSSDFERELNEETYKTEVFIIVNIKEEIFNIAFYVDKFEMQILNQIDFQKLFDICLHIKNSVGLRVHYPNKTFEVRNLQDFTLNSRINIYTPKINLSTEDKEKFYKLFEAGGAKLRVHTLADIDFKDKYTPRTIEDFQKFILELKDLLNNNPHGIESVFHQKLKDNMIVFNLFGKKYESHPKGFELSKNEINIHNFNYLIPDFLVEQDDGTVVLIEIEKPDKKIMNKSGIQNYKLTQAISQINQWENLINRNPETLKSLMDTYPEICSKRKYMLVYGRDTDFKNNSEKLEFFGEILSTVSKNIEIITFDDLIKRMETVIGNITRSKNKYKFDPSNY